MTFSRFGKGAPRVKSARRFAFQGRVYASMAEANYACFLEHERRAGRVLWWEPQRIFRFVHNGVKLWSYRADFIVDMPNGERRVIDVKGMRTEVYAHNVRMMLAFYDCVIEEVPSRGWSKPMFPGLVVEAIKLPKVSRPTSPSRGPVAGASRPPSAPPLARLIARIPAPPRS